MPRKIQRGVWHVEEIGDGERIHFQRPRHSQLLTLNQDTPNLQREIVRSSRVRAGKLPQDTPIGRVPEAEHVALARFVAACILRVEGVVDEHDQPLEWADLSDAQRLEYVETLPGASRTVALYAALVLRMGLENQPQILDNLAAQLAEASAISEEE